MVMPKGLVVEAATVEATKPIDVQLTPRQRLVLAIVAEAAKKGVEVDETGAEAFVRYCEQVRDHLGGQTGCVWVDDEALAMHHGVMNAIMPDDVQATAGSAHDLLNCEVFPDRRQALMHSAREVMDVSYCTVEVLVVSRHRG
jgi:hypothetical protein